jgi:type I restriction enzyme S subunit
MKIKLESFLQEVSEKTTENDQFPVLTSSKAGLYLQSEYFNKQVASKDNTGYKIIKRGQFTYRAMSDTGEFFPNMLECTDIGIVSPAYPVFEISKSVVMPEFLKYYFKSNGFQQSIASFAQGSTRTSVKFGKLKTVDIDLPDTDKQKKIIEILDTAQSVIAHRTEEIQKLDELIKARFVEMFGDIPREGYMRVSDACTIITDGTHQPPKFVSEGIPFIFVSNLADNTVTYNAEKHISQETYDELIKRTPIEVGDVLLTTVGSYGHPAVVKSEKKFLFQRHIAYLKPMPEKINSTYLWGAFLSADGQRQIEEKVKGIAQKTLNLSEIKTIQIPLPTLEQQNAFEEFIAQLDKSKVAVQKSLDESQLLFDSLMQKYFG